MEKLFDLDEKINLIYNYNYNKISDNCAEIHKINHNNIKISDIKITKDDDISNEITDDLFNARFKILNYLPTANSVVIKRYSDSFPLSLFISPYKKTLDKNKLDLNKDPYFSYLFSHLVITNKTPHILLPIVNLDMRFNQLTEILKGHDSLNYFHEGIENNKFSDLFSVRVKEHFFKSMSLNQYLKKYNTVMKPFLFQMIHTLAVIQDEYPKFSHNQLSPSNIFVYLRKDTKSVREYSFNGKKYYVPNPGLDIKITNFGQAELESKNNKYYDLHYFLNTLLYKSKIDNIDDETKKFLDEILPKKYRGKNGKYGYSFSGSKELFKPAKLLNHSYFNDFTVKTNNVVSFIKPIEFLGYKTQLDSDHSSVFGSQSSVVYGTRKINKSSRKTKKINRTRVVEMKGGALEFLPPEKPENDPFESNQEKRNKPKPKFDKPKFDKPKFDKPKFDKPKFDKPKPKFDKSKPKFDKPIEEDSEEEPRRTIKEQKTSYISREQREREDKSKYLPRTRDQFAHHVVDKNLPQGVQYMQQAPMWIPVGANHYPFTGQTYQFDPRHVNIKKEYHLSNLNPAGDHSTLNAIYEDAFPESTDKFTFNTVKDRESIMFSMRKSMINECDGEETTISGKDNSLLSYISLGELNPYRLKPNPYDNLEKGFLIYNSAYPIKYNKENQMIDLERGAQGYNLRIYHLSLAENRSKSINKLIDWHKFNVWREINYYEYIRDNIIRSKVCPNFVNLMFYKTDTKSKINWDQISNLTKHDDPKIVSDMFKKQSNQINGLHYIKGTNLVSFNNTNTGILSLYRGSSGNNQDEDTYYYKTKYNNNKYELEIIKKTPQGKYLRYDDTTSNFADLGPNYNFNHKEYNRCEGLDKCKAKDDLTIDSGNSLIAMTEAPTMNIKKWYEMIYNRHGDVRTMVQTGYHSTKEWMSVLFQLTYTMAVLEKEKIYFKDMNLENNIFIRDTHTDREKPGMWEYNVNGTNFYVKHRGSILLFDSSFKGDSNIKLQTMTNANNYEDIHKIYLGYEAGINDSFKINPNEVRKFIRKSYINMLNEIKQLEDINEEVKDKLSELINLGNANDDKCHIFENLYKFTMFLDKSLGTEIDEEHQKFLNPIIQPNPKVGNIAIHRERYGVFRIVLVIKDLGNNNFRCITKDNLGFKEVDINEGDFIAITKERISPFTIKTLEKYSCSFECK